MNLPDKRLPVIDALKGMACVLIIWHHLAFYGPMSDVVHPVLPALTDWLYNYGRMAVQVFLVVGGFLAASSLAPAGIAASGQPGQLIFRRYRRLLKPYLVALVVSVLVAALVRPWFHDPSVSAQPTLFQLLAHVLLLQDLLDQEALSAGVWYVAIDFQLFAMSAMMFGITRPLQRRWPGLSTRLVPPCMGLALVLAGLSLFFFNRRAGLDMTGLYFFGSYALGMLAFWASKAARRGPWLLAIAALGGAALVLDFRGRLVVALAVAFALVWLEGRVSTARSKRWLRPLEQLGKMSYSVFLIHFSVCLLVNALVSHFWPTQLLVNALGLLAAFALSLVAGGVLYLGVESRRTSFPGLVKARFLPQ